MKDVQLSRGLEVIKSKDSFSLKKFIHDYLEEINVVPNLRCCSVDSLNLTALAGGAQVGATEAFAQFNTFTTVASANDSGILPPAIAGSGTIIIQNGAVNDLDIYPQVGEKINDIVNASWTISGGTITTFLPSENGNWIIFQEV